MLIICKHQFCVLQYYTRRGLRHFYFVVHHSTKKLSLV